MLIKNYYLFEFEFIIKILKIENIIIFHIKKSIINMLFYFNRLYSKKYINNILYKYIFLRDIFFNIMLKKNINYINLFYNNIFMYSKLSNYYYRYIFIIIINYLNYYKHINYQKKYKHYYEEYYLYDK